MNPETLELIENYIRKYGESSLLNKIKPTNQDEALTIICNAGIHPLHELHTRGEVFIASNGNLDFSSAESALREIKSILINVGIKLKEKRWSRVYLVPFGPAPLSMQIKAIVQKILEIDTIDVLHLGNGEHADIAINPRLISEQIN